MIFCNLLLLLTFFSITFVAPSASETIELGRLYGFEFCNQLEGSIFDLNSLIDYKHVQPHLSHESSSELRAAASMESPQLLSDTRVIFAEALDLLALSLHQTVIKENLDPIPFREHRSFKRPRSNSESARRFACFSLAEGIYEFAPFVSEGRTQRILQFVENQKYFGHQLSFAPFDINLAQKELMLRQESTGEYIGAAKNENHVYAAADGKLAFILMVHDNLANIKEILEDISKSQSTVLIHVDGKNPELKQELQEWLESEYELESHNPALVKVMAKSFKGAWGHSSLLFMQLEAMFELLAINDKWEYVINMSGYDTLLVDHETIYNRLSEYGDGSWVTMNIEIESNTVSRTRQLTTLLTANNQKAGNLGYNFARKAPFHRFHNSQWMMLPRSTALRIQQSPSAATYLAHQEFSEIPDETYMSNLLAFSPFLDKSTGGVHRFPIVNNRLRYLKITDHHATFIDDEHEQRLQWAVENFHAIIARKVDYVKESSLVAWIRRKKITHWTQGQ